MTPMTERAAIGTRWRRRRDKTIWRVTQSHRADRIAELHQMLDDQLVKRRLFVSFKDLRTKFEQV